MEANTPQSIDPSLDQARFRGALGSFVTGVTVVSTLSPEGPVAIVANSFASVSLDPPLVLWSPAKASHRFKYFADAKHFVINVLSSQQRDVCSAVLGSKLALSACATHQSAFGVPIIEDALATFECTLETTHDAGDHVIVVGRVIRAHQRDGDPLVFHNGKYGNFHQA